MKINLTTLGAAVFTVALVTPTAQAVPAGDVVQAGRQVLRGSRSLLFADALKGLQNAESVAVRAYAQLLTAGNPSMAESLNVLLKSSGGIAEFNDLTLIFIRKFGGELGVDAKFASTLSAMLMISRENFSHEVAEVALAHAKSFNPTFNLASFREAVHTPVPSADELIVLEGTDPRILSEIIEYNTAMLQMRPALEEAFANSGLNPSISARFAAGSEVETSLIRQLKVALRLHPQYIETDLERFVRIVELSGNHITNQEVAALFGQINRARALSLLDAPSMRRLLMGRRMLLTDILEELGQRY